MYIFWTITGILFLIQDLLKKSTLKLSFASAALFCAIIAYKYPTCIFAHIVSFAVFLPIFYILLSTIIKKENSDIDKIKTLDNIAGKLAKVTKDIGKTLSIDGIGRIEYNGRIWQAKSTTDSIIKAGQTVEIVSRENMIMNVKVKEHAKN